MSTHEHSVDPDSEIAIYGKLFGIFNDHMKVKDFKLAVPEHAVDNIEVIEGNEGVLLLSRWENTVSGYLMGDMEQETIRLYLDAVRQGLVVFSVSVKSDEVEAIAAVAKRSNAARLVYFGESVVTSY